MRANLNTFWRRKIKSLYKRLIVQSRIKVQVKSKKSKMRSLKQRGPQATNNTSSSAHQNLQQQPLGPTQKAKNNFSSHHGQSKQGNQKTTNHQQTISQSDKKEGSAFVAPEYKESINQRFMRKVIHNDAVGEKEKNQQQMAIQSCGKNNVSGGQTQIFFSRNTKGNSGVSSNSNSNANFIEQMFNKEGQLLLNSTQTHPSHIQATRTQQQSSSNNPNLTAGGLTDLIDGQQLKQQGNHHQKQRMSETFVKNQLKQTLLGGGGVNNQNSNMSSSKRRNHQVNGSAKGGAARGHSSSLMRYGPPSSSDQQITANGGNAAPTSSSQNNSQAIAMANSGQNSKNFAIPSTNQPKVQIKAGFRVSELSGGIVPQNSSSIHSKNVPNFGSKSQRQSNVNSQSLTTNNGATAGVSLVGLKNQQQNPGEHKQTHFRSTSKKKADLNQQSQTSGMPQINKKSNLNIKQQARSQIVSKGVSAATTQEGFTSTAQSSNDMSSTNQSKVVQRANFIANSQKNSTRNFKRIAASNSSGVSLGRLGKSQTFSHQNQTQHQPIENQAERHNEDNTLPLSQVSLPQTVVHQHHHQLQTSSLHHQTALVTQTKTQTQTHNSTNNANMIHQNSGTKAQQKFQIGSRGIRNNAVNCTTKSNDNNKNDYGEYEGGLVNNQNSYGANSSYTKHQQNDAFKEVNMSLAGKIQAFNSKKALQQSAQLAAENHHPADKTKMGGKQENAGKQPGKEGGFHSVNISRNSSQTRHLSENVHALGKNRISLDMQAQIDSGVTNRNAMPNNLFSNAHRERKTTQQAAGLSHLQTDNEQTQQQLVEDDEAQRLGKMLTGSLAQQSQNATHNSTHQRGKISRNNPSQAERGSYATNVGLRFSSGGKQPHQSTIQNESSRGSSLIPRQHSQNHAASFVNRKPGSSKRLLRQSQDQNGKHEDREEQQDDDLVLHDALNPTIQQRDRNTQLSHNQNRNTLQFYNQPTTLSLDDGVSSSENHIENLNQKRKSNRLVGQQASTKLDGGIEQQSTTGIINLNNKLSLSAQTNQTNISGKNNATGLSNNLARQFKTIQATSSSTSKGQQFLKNATAQGGIVGSQTRNNPNGAGNMRYQNSVGRPQNQNLSEAHGTTGNNGTHEEIIKRKEGAKNPSLQINDKQSISSSVDNSNTVGNRQFQQQNQGFKVLADRGRAGRNELNLSQENSKSKLFQKQSNQVNPNNSNSAQFRTTGLSTNASKLLQKSLTVSENKNRKKANLDVNYTESAAAGEEREKDGKKNQVDLQGKTNRQQSIGGKQVQTLQSSKDEENKDKNQEATNSKPAGQQNGGDAQGGNGMSLNQNQQQSSSYPFMNNLRAIASGQQSQIHCAPIRSTVDHPLKDFEPAKFASKTHGLITSYAANTHQGIQRDYNEDRVSIILNMTRPSGRKDVKVWPKCSYFAIYDGHGGSACSDFLKDQLHLIIISQDTFPKDPAQALTTGCLEAERKFLEDSENKKPSHERSGSCAIIVLIVEQECFVANVGDSRAIMSADKGRKLFLLSRDHRPSESYEVDRIVKNGGGIYQTQSVQNVPVDGNNPTGPTTQQIVLGPHRVLPGRLSVSRTFGDIEAKKIKYGGKDGVIIAQPEISQFTVKPAFHDFIVLGCDGIFDRLSNQQVLDTSWETCNQIKGAESRNFSSLSRKSVHQVSGSMADAVIKQAAIERSMDNLTLVIITFANMESFLSERPYNMRPDNNLFQIKESEVESGATTNVLPSKAISQVKHPRNALFENSGKDLKERLDEIRSNSQERASETSQKSRSNHEKQKNTRKKDKESDALSMQSLAKVKDKRSLNQSGLSRNSQNQNLEAATSNEAKSVSRNSRNISSVLSSKKTGVSYSPRISTKNAQMNQKSARKPKDETASYTPKSKKAISSSQTPDAKMLKEALQAATKNTTSNFTATVAHQHSHNMQGKFLTQNYPGGRNPSQKMQTQMSNNSKQQHQSVSGGSGQFQLQNNSSSTAPNQLGLSREARLRLSTTSKKIADPQQSVTTKLPLSSKHSRNFAIPNFEDQNLEDALKNGDNLSSQRKIAGQPQAHHHYRNMTQLDQQSKTNCGGRGTTSSSSNGVVKRSELTSQTMMDLRNSNDQMTHKKGEGKKRQPGSSGLSSQQGVVGIHSRTTTLTHQRDKPI